MADLFSRGVAKSLTPLTADLCKIKWGPAEGAAVQVQVSYQQQINRRRSIGNKQAVIWASMPQGQMTIGRLMLADTPVGGDGFEACKPSEIIITTAAGCDGDIGPKFTAKGCIVSQYTLTLEAESLTVMDNMVVEFLTLETSG